MIFSESRRFQEGSQSTIHLKETAPGLDLEDGMRVLQKLVCAFEGGTPLGTGQHGA